MSMWGFLEHNSLEIMIIFQTTNTENQRRHPWWIPSYIFSRVVSHFQPKSSESEPPEWKHTKIQASWRFQSELSHPHFSSRGSAHGWRGDTLHCDRLQQLGPRCPARWHSSDWPDSATRTSQAQMNWRASNIAALQSVSERPVSGKTTKSNPQRFFPICFNLPFGLCTSALWGRRVSTQVQPDKPLIIPMGRLALAE